MRNGMCKLMAVAVAAIASAMIAPRGERVL